MFGASRIAAGRGPVAARFGRAVAMLAALQLVLGAINVILLAPVWMQLVHLSLAYGVWLALVALWVALVDEAPEWQARVSLAQRPAH